MAVRSLNELWRLYSSRWRDGVDGFQSIEYRMMKLVNPVWGARNLLLRSLAKEIQGVKYSIQQLVIRRSLSLLDRAGSHD